MKTSTRPPAPREVSGSSRKIGNTLAALSSAAVLAVYTAGYLRTRTAAEKFTVAAAQRRPPVPSTPRLEAGGAAPSVDISAIVPLAPAPAPGPPSRVGEPVVRPAPEPSRPASVPARASVPRPTVQPPTVAPTATAPAPAAASVAPLAATPETPPAPVVTPAVVQPPAPELAVAPVAPKIQYKDGTYSGWGTSRHGDIQATVIVEGGRIVSAVIAQCLTRYSCSWIAALPPQVAIRQSPEVDYVSGATQSTNAFYYAVVDALSKAK